MSDMKKYIQNILNTNLGGLINMEIHAVSIHHTMFI